MEEDPPGGVEFLIREIIVVSVQRDRKRSGDARMQMESKWMFGSSFYIFCWTKQMKHRRGINVIRR